MAGIVMVYTGHGKGKTCAAMGQAMRAAGHGLRVCLLQFIKARPTGESAMLAVLAERIEYHQVGSGFSWQQKDQALFRETALAGWQLALEKLAGGYDLLVLDELTYLIHFGFLTETEVVAALAARPAGMHVVITGRHAGSELLAAADLVTEMRELKHPYRLGIQAQKGVEF